MDRKINLKTISNFKKASWHPAPVDEVSSVCIDSRKCTPGSLFVALGGEKTDGHRFVGDALKNGAVAAMVREKQDVDIPQLIVKNTEYALQELARRYRRMMDSYVIGITGSCGKTTLKEMLSSVLQARYTVGKTPGNYNNQLGLPLTVLNQGGRDVLVAEVGTNAPGEIEFLAEILNPDMGIITHIGPAHLQGLKSLEEVAREKSALLAGLGNDGVAFIPETIEYIDLLKKNSAVRPRLVGSSSDADFFARWEENCSGTILRTDAGEMRLAQCRVDLLQNASLALAAASSLGINNEEFEDWFSRFEIPAGRGSVIDIGGCQVIDGSYNANPDSMASALSYLNQLPSPSLAVVGEMKELGGQAEDLHRKLGKLLRQLEETQVHYVGGFAGQVAEGSGDKKIYFHESVEEIIDLDPTNFKSALVKSSHAVGLYRLVERWTESL